MITRHLYPQTAVKRRLWRAQGSIRAGPAAYFYPPCVSHARLRAHAPPSLFEIGEGIETPLSSGQKVVYITRILKTGLGLGPKVTGEFSEGLQRPNPLRAMLY